MLKFEARAQDHLSDDLLNDYLDGLLEAGQIPVFQAHLAGCEICSGRLAALQVLFEQISTLPEEALRVDLAPGVLAALQPVGAALPAPQAAALPLKTQTADPAWRFALLLLFQLLAGGVLFALALPYLQVAERLSPVTAWIQRLGDTGLLWQRFEMFLRLPLEVDLGGLVQSTLQSWPANLWQAVSHSLLLAGAPVSLELAMLLLSLALVLGLVGNRLLQSERRRTFSLLVA